ncbi:MAG: hypothetical protein E7Z72_05885 [Methanocorpusculum parvum]|nr:hypothetical protein [Methanocorpusculum parvum]
MPDDADARLTRAAVSFSEGAYEDAVSELFEAAGLLASEGAGLIRSVSASEFENPVFTTLLRITPVFENLPESADIQRLLPGYMETPVNADSPARMLSVVSDIYEKAEDEPDGEETDFSLLKTLLSLLLGQQTFRSLLFAEDGMYASAASSASAYLAGVFVFRGDDIDSAVEKADSMLFGPVKRLAELLYSLLTSALTAGLLLLAIRRAIPFMRPSKKQTVFDAAVLTVSQIPDIIKGLRAVAEEISVLKAIIRGNGENR